MNKFQLKVCRSSLIAFLFLMLTACGGGNSGTRTPIIPTKPDTTSPVITLTGKSTISIVKNSSYNDAGATARDNHDGNITAKIKVAGDIVNTDSEPGTTFTITYNVSDAAGNLAIEVTRNVSIIEASNNEHQIPALSEAEIVHYLTVINIARSEAKTCNGTGNYPAVAAVVWSDKLYKAAYEHSQDLSTSNTFAHDGSGTTSDWSGYALNKQSSIADRVSTYNYSWSRISENISAGTTRDTAQKAIDSWLASSGHCHNIMSANVTEVGMALSTNQSSTYTNYWTQNFAKPR